LLFYGLQIDILDPLITRNQHNWALSNASKAKKRNRHRSDSDDDSEEREPDFTETAYFQGYAKEYTIVDLDKTSAAYFKERAGG